MRTVQTLCLKLKRFVQNQAPCGLQELFQSFSTTPPTGRGYKSGGINSLNQIPQQIQALSLKYV